MSKQSKKRSLKIERLENRQVMAGNVFAGINTSGDLIIIGDAGHNEIDVITNYNPRAANNSVVVRGLLGTLINGAAEQTLNGFTRDMSVDLREGNDHFGLDVSVPRNLTVQLGNGNNGFGSAFANRITGNLSFQSGTGNDSINLLRNTIFGNVNIQTGDGADDIAASDTYFAKTLQLDTGKGDDALKLIQSSVDQLFADMGSGNDAVNLKGYFPGPLSPGGVVLLRNNSTIKLGTGDDKLTADVLELRNGIFKVMGGAGNDIVSMSNVTGAYSGIGSNAVYIDMEEGHDTTNLSNMTMGFGVLYVHGGSGNDTTTLSNVSTPSLTHSAAAGNDKTTLNNVTVTDAILGGGAGLDTLDVTNFVVKGTKKLTDWERGTGLLAVKKK